ncbi:hypothetical protein Nepgr_024896 [Nepenthes gracilis]|uniref:Peptidase M16 C-terminal domain-containing protein n=1 Tax=Nepenthes gracilis TaxID=150966 RepID=A0AAD3XZ75_NEPGR|nr:hypothetical protein Nepgr_024896 [Nepenthes gracilis]
MLNGYDGSVEPTPESLHNLTLQSVKDAVMNQFIGANMEVSIVSDFSQTEIESCICDYLGMVRATHMFDRDQISSPITFRPSPSDLLQRERRDFTLQSNEPDITITTKPPPAPLLSAMKVPNGQGMCLREGCDSNRNGESEIMTVKREEGMKWWWSATLATLGGGCLGSVFGCHHS